MTHQLSRVQCWTLVEIAEKGRAALTTRAVTLKALEHAGVIANSNDGWHLTDLGEQRLEWAKTRLETRSS